MKQLVIYGNREFLRSFRLRTEIIKVETNGSSGNNNKETTATATDTAIISLSLIPAFQSIGFLAAVVVD